MVDINTMFEHIVEESFYSRTMNGVVRVDDLGNVYVNGSKKRELTKGNRQDDNLVEVFFFEWCGENDLSSDPSMWIE